MSKITLLTMGHVTHGHCANHDEPIKYNKGTFKVPKQIVFYTTATPDNVTNIRLLVDSLRSFGGELAGAPFWIFCEDPPKLHELREEKTVLLPLTISPVISSYPFGKTVAACAYAEQLASAAIQTLVWVDPNCLFVQPPVLFELDDDVDAAFRPVHIRNIGISPTQELDIFWQYIYNTLGILDIPLKITSFVDNQPLRAYFNSHAFSIKPTLGIMRHWYDYFQQLVCDGSFQAAACRGAPHSVFLFQAILSTLVASKIQSSRLRILPATYNYPYHLHERVPVDKRAVRMDELVCFTYENRTIHPAAIDDIQINKSLQTWLEARVEAHQL